MSDMQKNEILLESGTNEIEIMEFIVDGGLYGINVAKVREIMLAQDVKQMPHSHEDIEGVFKPREVVITVVNLPKYLTKREIEKQEKDLFIITHFNKIDIAFRVNSVEGINRISWQAIQKPDPTLFNNSDGVVTGIAHCNGRIVSVLDFEKIVSEIAPQTGIQLSEIEALKARESNNVPIWVAEDSALLSKMIQKALNDSGYNNIKMYPNGAELWQALQESDKKGTLQDDVKLVITDIEMPQMDGHRLTKLIKSTEQFLHLPVVIFSSLITHQMQIKGKELGASEQLSKPEIGRLVEVVDSFVLH